ncbi:MAG: WecB/TagA/CpsF family glycosyltransferase, partial [Planctomycetes bacterium]|nr:WecB/TagA/CpsF family glycosyltransferase [Planctomycetota bacterium]
MADFFKKADIVHIDGVGIILGAKFLGHTVSDRLTWADWAWPLAKHFAMEGQRLFLLGGPDGLTREAAAKLKAHAPGLQIVGAYHGYFAKQGPENDSIIEMINQANPDVLWVGLGMPLQERWILDNYQRMNVKMYMTCGAGFKHMAGWLKRSPQWFI